MTSHWCGEAVIVQSPGRVTIDNQQINPPQEGEVLVEVLAAGACFHDVLVADGLLRNVTYPRIMGHEVAGRIVELGPCVSDWRIGDAVTSTQRFASCGVCSLCRSGKEALCRGSTLLGDEVDGGYAQFCVLSASSIAHIPGNVDINQAATAACVVGTSLNAVRDVANVRLGEWVLVTGASGGLGHAAVQLAAASGGRVIASTRTQSNAERLLALGAEVVAVVGDGPTLSEQVRAVVPAGVDVVIDCVGAAVFDQARKSLGISGRYALVGELGDKRVELNLAQLFLKGIDLLSVHGTSLAQLQDSLELMARGIVNVDIEDVVPMSAANIVHQQLRHGDTRGRIILTPSPLNHDNAQKAG